MLSRYYIKDRRVGKMLRGYCGGVRVKQRSLTSWNHTAHFNLLTDAVSSSSYKNSKSYNTPYKFNYDI